MTGKQTLQHGRRRFLRGGLAVATLAGTPLLAGISRAETQRDLVIIGAGTAGLPAALFAAKRGASVTLVDVADIPGGSLLMSFGQMSAAGTQVQADKDIEDSPDLHFEDIMRISRGTADRALVRLAVDEAPGTFDWLMARGFQMRPEHPVMGRAHEPYSVARYYWGEQYGFSILEVLLAELEPYLSSGQVRMHLQTRAVALHQGRGGEIIGLRCTDARGSDRIFHGRHYLLASGGYGANTDLFERLTGVRDYGDASYPHANGIGIELGLSVGGFVRGRENYLTSFGAIMETDTIPAKVSARFNHFPERRQPWEIYVNVRGERFVREDEPSVDRREHALREQPDLRYWVIFDEHIFANAPVGVEDSTREQVRARFNRHPMFASAQTLDELASRTGIDPGSLRNTVADYNRGVARGDDRLGRSFMPSGIQTAPFYAIRMQGYSVTSTVGLAVDSELRVLRGNGQSIPNLYAAGELLGTGQLMGKSFCGGMMVTPALAFGRLIGSRVMATG